MSELTLPSAGGQEHRRGRAAVPGRVRAAQHGRGEPQRENQKPEGVWRLRTGLTGLYGAAGFHVISPEAAGG